MQPTPLRGHKIVAFLKAGFGPTVFPIYRGGAADGQLVGRARATHAMNGQRPIQPRDCCGPIVIMRESGIRAPSRGTHPVPGQASTGKARERHSNGTHPTAVVVGTPSRAAPSNAITGHASDRHRAQPRWEGTHPNAVAGNARGRQLGWQVVASLRRGAAQPAHAARRRTRPEIGAILNAGISYTAITIYPAARLMRHALGVPSHTFATPMALSDATEIPIDS